MAGHREGGVMGLFLFAWLTGEGIIVYRWVKNGAPPTPGALLLPSGIYLALAILAEYQPARFAAIAAAWGLDIAVLLQVVGKDPKQVTGWPPGPIPAGALLPNGATGTQTAAGTVGAAIATGVNEITAQQPVK
jgi:hypothetical protein